MSDKPSYLGLLNAIAIGEQQGYRLFDAWTKATGNSELAAALRKVALREQDHAAAFTKRINELGYDLRPSPTREFKAAVKLARSDAPDVEKFEKLLNYSQSDEENKNPHKKKPRKNKKDPLAKIFRDKTIDIQTGTLLGRFIAEERDSERLLRSCYYSLCKQGLGETDATEASLRDLGQRLDRLSVTLEELKHMRSQSR